MISDRQLAGVRYGKRIMIDIRDLKEWILSHKVARITGETWDPMSVIERGLVRADFQQKEQQL